jgi:hypothetical protein
MRIILFKIDGRMQSAYLGGKIRGVMQTPISEHALSLTSNARLCVGNQSVKKINNTSDSNTSGGEPARFYVKTKT